jgi:hypothetical protein
MAAPSFVPRDARYHRALGAALAGTGDYEGAVAAVERALAILVSGAEQAGAEMRVTLEQELARYRNRRPPPAPGEDSR